MMRLNTWLNQFARTFDMPDCTTLSQNAPRHSLWTRVTDFVLKLIFSEVHDDSLTIDERERRDWDRAW